MNIIQKLIDKFSTSSIESRYLQVNGLIRFFFVLLQGVFMAKSDLPMEVIGMIEILLFAIYFGKYAAVNGGLRGLYSLNNSAEQNLKYGHIKPGTLFFGSHVFSFLLGGFAILYLFLKPEVAESLGDPWLIYSCVFGAVFFGVSSEYYEYHFVKRKAFKQLLTFGTIYHLVSLVILIVFVIYKLDVKAYLLGLVAWTFLRWLHVLILYRHSFIYTRKNIWSGILFLIPLILHNAITNLMTFVDPIIITNYFGPEDFVIYRYGAREFPLIGVYISAIVSGLIYTFTKDGLKYQTLKQEISKLMHVVMPIACLLILFSPKLFQIVYRDEFIQSALIFNVYLFILVSQVLMVQIVFFVKKMNWKLVWFSIYELIVNVFLSVILLQYFGVVGVALATVLAFAIHRLCMMLYLKYNYEIEFSKFYPVWTHVAYTALLLGAFYTSYSWFFA